MSIDTEKEYDPLLEHPLYVKIIPEEHNTYELWDKYEIRIPDEEGGEDGPYNYVFDAILVGKEIEEWGYIPAILKAYAARTRDAQEALERIHPLGEEGSFNGDDELAVLIFLRIDQTKKFITMDNDVLLAQDGDIE